MLTLVLAVAIAGIALLAFAVITNNTIVALLAIVLAVVGLVLLARDWLHDRRDPGAHRRDDARSDANMGPNGHYTHDESLEPDMFEPDVAYDEGEEAEAADDEVDERDSGAT